MAVISVEYEEMSKKPDLGYKSVSIYYGGQDKHIFNSGDFIKDWYDCNKCIITELADKESHFARSSTVDNFIMDGASKLYDSCYLKFHKKKQPYLSYKREDKALEFFVKSGTTPTWDELREICGDKKKTQ